MFTHILCMNVSVVYSKGEITGSLGLNFKYHHIVYLHDINLHLPTFLETLGILGSSNFCYYDINKSVSFLLFIFL
jgi:hypothetical protein